MFVYLENATCMICEKSGEGNYIQIEKKLFCKRCGVLHAEDPIQVINDLNFSKRDREFSCLT